MLRPRIIPCLLVHAGGLVKTVEFREPKYVGDPINAVKIFNEKSADELIVLDIDASVAGAEPNFRLISQFAAECRMPLCYGGGVKTVEHAKRIVSLGVEKVAISSAALEQPELVSRIASEIGSQSVVVVLDVKSRSLGRSPEIWTHNGTRNTKRPVLEAVKEFERLGAGEIVINSIERDGRMQGYDLELARRCRELIGSPLTMLGGAGSLAHLEELIHACGLVGAAAGSLFVFKGAYRAVLINYPNPEQKEDLVRRALGSAAELARRP
jgi:imidazole glycerol-phosphate synthase subunit HisF